MRHKCTILAVVLTALFTLLLGVSAGQASAQKRAANPVCEAFGQNLCLGANSLSEGYGVILKPFGSGRNMQFNLDGGQLCVSAGCFNTGTLVFTGGTNTCAVAITSGNVLGNVKVGGCTEQGVTWAIQDDAGHERLINRWWTLHTPGPDSMLNGDDTLGDVVTVAQRGCSPGCYQAWDFL